MSSKYLQAITLALAALLAACSPIKVLNALTPSNTFTKTASIAYGDDPRQKLDVYRPVTAPQNAPVVVFFYGGSWNSGAKEDYAFVGEALASRGIVVVVADYRLYPQVRYPAFLQDGAKALAWAHQHIADYAGDPTRLYVMGHSSGAYNASMLALDARWLNEVGLAPSILKGWIGLAGPYDFLPIENPDVKPVFFFPDSPPESQPINHVSRDAPPSLLIASTDDSLVNPTRNTGGLAKKLREAGVPVETFYFTKTGHATLVASIAKPLRWLAPVLDRVTAFIQATGPGGSIARQSPTK
ncbi:alpha/beta hydrolase fold domain-containing protein [Pseudomonas syringae]|uniref:Alpha/beta hydrolase fold domain-containing protein n=1 Tax=Pseudomonas syringae TaxID=317 RepID=A0A9Q3ZUU7_PSESX|nr:alpha/beta hydrolase fold domain-containing protein [Pseudomonas syringae]MCF5063670.1 alpha/beta hydrolase fold domain-containing protein [Pseudomonas syringae]MCF5073588.1 alpha/beta hydrolase fold domain-containing protein [Pseudomonas syringae]MCF5119031.1 alpha/beta hydrolase fold domain-containing protein [Pseudomonas syringae]MCF5377313.1 alpha/beta hydrolase fold domain-containing protein [Pseudomonas syringae]